MRVIACYRLAQLPPARSAGCCGSSTVYLQIVFLGATGGGENLHLIYIPWWQVYWSVFYIAKLKIAAPGVSYKRKDAYLQIVESDKVKSTITAEKKAQVELFVERNDTRTIFFEEKKLYNQIVNNELP